MAKRAAAKKKPVKKKKLFIPYPLVVFLMLCAGAFLVACTFGVSADEVAVTARIKGPAITSPAIINSPADGTHFSAVPVTVTGSCPPNAAYVEIYRNNVLSGSAICLADKTFDMKTDLFPGTNELLARVFNVTDDEGPVSDKVTVYYDVPQPPASTPGTSTGSGQTPPGGSKKTSCHRCYLRPLSSTKATTWTSRSAGRWKSPAAARRMP